MSGPSPAGMAVSILAYRSGQGICCCSILMFGYLAVKSPTIPSRILPSGPVRPFQKVKVTFWVGTAMSPAAAGLASGLAAAGAVVAAAWAAGAAGLAASAGFDSAGLAGALVGAGVLAVLPHACSSPPATTVVAATPNSRRNARRSSPSRVLVMAPDSLKIRLSRTRYERLGERGGGSRRPRHRCLPARARGYGWGSSLPTPGAVPPPGWLTLVWKTDRQRLSLTTVTEWAGRVSSRLPPAGLACRSWTVTASGRSNELRMCGSSPLTS